MTPTAIIAWAGQRGPIHRLKHARELQHLVPGLANPKPAPDRDAGPAARDFLLPDRPLAGFAAHLERHPAHAQTMLAVIEDALFLGTQLRLEQDPHHPHWIIRASPMLKTQIDPENAAIAAKLIADDGPLAIAAAVARALRGGYTDLAFTLDWTTRSAALAEPTDPYRRTLILASPASPLLNRVTKQHHAAATLPSSTN